MFSSEAYGQKNLLFKDATSELVPIATQTYEAWLGPEYLHAMKGLLCDPNRKSTHLFSCCPQPTLTTRMAGLSGEVARGGRPPWYPLVLTRTCLFHHLPLGVWGGNTSGVQQPFPGSPASPGGGIQATRACHGKGLLAPSHRSHQVLSFSLHNASLLLLPGSATTSHLNLCSSLQMGFLPPASSPMYPPPTNKDMVCH